MLLLVVLLIGFTIFSIFNGVRAQRDNLFPERFEIFQDIFYIIKNYYVTEVNPDELIDGAIKGMLRTLDSYSTYLPEEDYDEMQVQIKGEYGGLGFIITLRNEELTIVSPFEGTPACRAGLQAGDVIMEVDGDSTEGWSLDRAVNRMRGDEGTEVTLKIKRLDGDEKETFTLDIIREIIEVPFIEEELLEDRIGYINLIQFGEDVGFDLQQTLNNLKDEGAEAFILDLRNNAGGLLDEAVSVASNFIQEEPIVHIEQRDDTQTLNALPIIRAVDEPLVVLVNKGSASGSEIVAAAIKDTERGALIGTNTFGKATVQSVVPMEDGSALRLTTARYLTSGKNVIGSDGLEPDILIEEDIEAEDDLQLERALEYLREILEDELAQLPAAG